jgi:hypothetical protein
MLENHNIKWVNDDLEEDVYDVILSFIFGALNKLVF